MKTTKTNVARLDRLTAKTGLTGIGGGECK
jgi:hypothetical protein